MPRKAFIADLEKAIGGLNPIGISNVRKGGDDGEFTFLVKPGPDQAPIELTGSISDVSDYPSEHTCFFFAPGYAPPAVLQKLGSLLDATAGKPIYGLLELVSNVAVSTGADGAGDTPMPDSQGGEQDDDFPESDPDSDSEDEFFPEPQGMDYQGRLMNIDPFSSQPADNEPSTAALRDRIRYDLNIAKAAGFKIGHLGRLLDNASSYVTVSCRISKLGISEQAVQAWRLEPTDYLILILHYPHGYKDVNALMGCDSDAGRRNLSMRIGVSNTYKPTFQEAVHAFTTVVTDRADEDRNGKPCQDEQNKGFRNSFLSRPLNQLFNERLLRIVHFRYASMGWTGAEEFLNDHMANISAETDNVGDSYMMPDEINEAYPPIVNADHITEAGTASRHSFPLIAMQFLLRHFVRCTEFCLVCFRRLPSDFEAIKPYVCENPLCLYQYMSLGFGPSIEHEIMTQPHVADLLISFCFASAQLKTLKDFPTGMSLMVPPVNALDLEMGPAKPAPGTYSYYQQPVAQPEPDSQIQVSGIDVKLDYTLREVLLDKGSPSPVKPGDWIVIEPSQTSVRLHCRVISTALFPTVEISDAHTYISSPVPPAPYASIYAPKPSVQAKKNSHLDWTNLDALPIGFVAASMYIYNQNFDELTESSKQRTITGLLSLMPSVAEMQSYLLSKSNMSLSSWVNRIPPASFGLLRWIIASSRACIMQLDNFDTETVKGKKKFDERVHGMDGWVQFKFAMGAPDKERRFVNSVKSTAARLGLKYPSLFAWHGSPLSNWHSIIREGLHFNKISHGRAFGNGVYHSLFCQTSIGYSSTYQAATQACVWPQSALQITSALALNEIVNAPQEYVSSNPHLVVAQLDWIQTRYMFVKVGSELKPTTVERPNVHLDQDPNMTPVGEKNEKIIIPRNVTMTRPSPVRTPKNSKGVKAGLFGSKIFGPSGTKEDPVNLVDDDDDAASVATLPEDLDILKDDGPVTQPAASQNGRTLSNKLAKPMTDFVPGSLDHSTLPKLEPPSWATTSATKRLQQDFKALLKVQEREPLHELGWYVDPELITNMYQWIVELHSFEPHLPLAKDMKKKGITSIVLELRFGKEYPMTPPFVRVIRPRFLGFLQGGGGHVTAGGALCMELLTNNGWSAVSSIESVLLQIRLAMSSTDPHPARLAIGVPTDYGVWEAVEAYQRACRTHGWTVPPGFQEMAFGGEPSSAHL